MQGSLAEKLRLLRAERGLTLKDAGALLGVDRHTLRRVELGIQEPLYPTLKKIADGYGVPVEELLKPEAPKAEAPSQLRSGQPELAKLPEDRREELERLGELVLDMHNQLEEDAKPYRSAKPYDLETFAARAYVEALGARQFVDNEVRPAERHAAARAYETLGLIDGLVEGLVADARASREAGDRRSRMHALPWFREAG